MRVLICGSRDYNNSAYMARILDALHNDNPFTCVIEGEALGADTLARFWAERRGIPVEKYPANWKEFGRAAGPIRNKQMLVEGKPDLVIAFPIHPVYPSKGTANMISQAQKAGIEVEVF